MSGKLDTLYNYSMRLLEAYGSFLVPVAMFVVFNSCIDQHTRDPEKLSLLWLKFNQGTESTRAKTFPAQQPGTMIDHGDDGIETGSANEEDEL